MDNQIHNAIVSFIWGIADDCLRDVYVRGKYRDVILPMTVIRRLDAMLEDTKPAVLNMKKMMDEAGITNQWPALCNAAGQAFCNSSPFLLRDLTSRAKKQTLKADFEAYLDGFSPNVQEILEKFKFRNQIDTMIDADILGAVIEKFISPTINLSPKPVYTDDTMKTIKLPALDNHGMGTIFEELIRKFNEENNEEAGEHWTPRDVVDLMADLIIVPVADQIMDATYSCYDGACGTGGMLTVAQDRLLTSAMRRGKNVSIHLFGQELQPETYAICKADMLLKGDGEQAEHIAYGSTLSADGNATRQFDFMLANPPYGKSWKTDAEKMGGKKDILDSRFVAYMEDGTQLTMIPRTSDGQLLFLLNNVSKMKTDTQLGSRIAEVHNASSLFTGDAGSGESNARRYLFENDLVEAIIALPENMFYNTKLATYIWVLSNKKEARRVGKVQLIDKMNHFAVIIDEAHSGQSGRNSAQMNLALSGLASEDEMDNEDKINAMMEGRKLLTNASYFAFTATPKNKTLETFGVAYEDGDDVKHRPYHVYTMKQAIQEGFILDVLKYYTPIASYYKLMKTVQDDPMFDKKRAQKKLRAFVESDSYTIAQKAEMMVAHFHEQVISKGKIGGQARAMVVTSSIPRCIEYYYAINKCLAARHSPYKAIVAFSGEHKYQGQEPPLTSAAMNGFPDAKIPSTLKSDPYRLLVVADMFQTGFDEPLLHTMYVDKMLYDIKAVQTLSRLNRCHPAKHDTFVLDFANKPAMIEEAFSRYYRTTLLSGETDPNKLYDLIAMMEEYQVYSEEHVMKLVDLYLNGAERDRLDPILDACAAVYKDLDTEDQIKFKSAAKSFCRTYGFLGAILPYGNAEWERLSIFMNLLIPKLPSPRDDDFSEGILDVIDLDSYRLEAQESMSIKLEDSDTEVPPVPAGKSGHIVNPEMDLLSVILNDFNDMFGNIDWKEPDNVRRQIIAIPEMVAKDERYQNAMKNSDRQNARMESERALQQVIFSVMADNMELFKQFQDNPSFKKWLSDMVFNMTYEPTKEKKVVTYDFAPKAEPLMVAEEPAPYGGGNQ